MPRRSDPDYCLVEWLRLKHNVSIDALETPKLDDSGLDIDHDPARYSSGAGRQQDRPAHRRGRDGLHLSVRHFGMWKDLSEHWEVLEQSPIVRT
ncbi:hypothetical protein GS575_27950 [Rhodococcus hoagii]|nr:hypothetical protein [Prescottella equi]